LEKEMNWSSLELPSNRKFGFFFSIVFLAAAIYFYINNTDLVVYVLGILSALFFVITFVKADLLLPLNKLWMKVGFMLGIILSPIVLGIIFFFLFTPIAFHMRLFGRDELKLRFKKQPSYWIKRDKEVQSDFYKNQF
jgi:hypothetical protein